MSSRALIRKYAWSALLIIPAFALWKIHPSSISSIALCGLKRMTGLNCPGCGATRASHYLLNGDVDSALQYNALFVILLPVAGLCLGYALWQSFYSKAPKLPYTALLIVLGVVLMAFGVVRNVPGYEWMNPPR